MCLLEAAGAGAPLVLLLSLLLSLLLLLLELLVLFEAGDAATCPDAAFESFTSFLCLTFNSLANSFWAEPIVLVMLFQYTSSCIDLLECSTFVRRPKLAAQ